MKTLLAVILLIVTLSADSRDTTIANMMQHIKNLTNIIEEQDALLVFKAKELADFKVGRTSLEKLEYIDSMDIHCEEVSSIGSGY